jgi:hypothetical protein
VELDANRLLNLARQELTVVWHHQTIIVSSLPDDIRYRITFKPKDNLAELPTYEPIEIDVPYYPFYYLSAVWWWSNVWKEKRDGPLSAHPGGENLQRKVNFARGRLSKPVGNGYKCDCGTRDIDETCLAGVNCRAEKI